jgi:4-oxalocrotonate tautomerase
MDQLSVISRSGRRRQWRRGTLDPVLRSSHCAGRGQNRSPNNLQLVAAEAPALGTTIEREIRMPHVHVKLMAGRSDEQLREMVKEITKAMGETVNAKPETVQIVVQEVSPDRWAVGGTLVSDR